MNLIMKIMLCLGVTLLVGSMPRFCIVNDGSSMYSIVPESSKLPPGSVTFLVQVCFSSKDVKVTKLLQLTPRGEPVRAEDRVYSLNSATASDEYPLSWKELNVVP